MGLARGDGRSFSCPRTLPDDANIPGTDNDLHPGDIGRRKAGPHHLGPYTLAVDGLPVPALKAKNAIGLGDDVPTLKIVEGNALSFPRLDMVGLDPLLKLAQL